MHHIQQHEQEAFFANDILAATTKQHFLLSRVAWPMQDAAYATHFTQLPNSDFLIGYHDGLIKTKNPISESILTPTHSKLHCLLSLTNGNILSNHENGKTYIWNQDKFLDPQKFTTGRTTTAVELADNIIAIGLQNSNILLFDPAEQNYVAHIGTPSMYISDILLPLLDGELLSCRRDTGTIYIWNIKTQRRIQCFRTRTDIYSLILLPDKQHIATSHRDGNIYIWNIPQEKCVAHIPDTGTLIHAIAALPNGYIAAGDAEGDIKIWNIPTERLITTISVKKTRSRLVLPTYVNHLLTLPNNRLAYTTNHDMGILTFLC